MTRITYTYWGLCLWVLFASSSFECLAQKTPAGQAATNGPATAAAVRAPEPRLALVIGNATYKTAPLVNPVKDSRAIARALGDAGFTVISRENAGQKEMQAALRDFGDTLKKTGGVGLVYYAGHGVQIKGSNYLIPVDASIEREDEVAYSSIDANLILDKMQSANNRLNILILDACRNNPFTRGSRSSSRGLAQMDAPVGTLVAFSTAPGMVASDGKGENGLYTQHLLEAIRTPGSKIEDVFKRVRASVRRESGGAQIPWESTSLEGDFIFVPALQKPAAQLSRTAPNKPIEKISEIPLPVAKVGDTWTWQLIDLFSGSVKSNYTSSVTTVTLDEIRMGTTVLDKSWNLLRRLTDNKVTSSWSPRRPLFDFPLYVGKTWNATASNETNAFRSDHEFSLRVVRQERVVVPAGTFDALRVEGQSKYKTVRKDGMGSGEGLSVWRYWFSIETGSYVAYEYEETNWKGVLHRKERQELISFKRSK